MKDISRIKLLGIIVVIVTLAVWALERLQVPGFHLGPVVVHSRSV